jgi:hypothetical protein
MLAQYTEPYITPPPSNPQSSSRELGHLPALSFAWQYVFSWNMPLQENTMPATTHVLLTCTYVSAVRACSKQPHMLYSTVSYTMKPGIAICALWQNPSHQISFSEQKPAAKPWHNSSRHLKPASDQGGESPPPRIMDKQPQYRATKSVLPAHALTTPIPPLPPYNIQFSH